MVKTKTPSRASANETAAEAEEQTPAAGATGSITATEMTTSKVSAEDKTLGNQEAPIEAAGSQPASEDADADPAESKVSTLPVSYLLGGGRREQRIQ